MQTNFFTPLKVELTSGHYDVIYIFENSDPQKLCQDFLIKHNLDFKIKNLLTRKIIDAKESALSEKNQNKNNVFISHAKTIKENLNEKETSPRKTAKTTNKIDELQNLFFFETKINSIMNQEIKEDNNLFRPQINPKSAFLAHKKNLSDVSVYERLFQCNDQKRKADEDKYDQMDFFKINRHIANSDRKVSPKRIHNGERMYLEAMRNKEKLRKIAEQRIIERILVEEKDLTFQPEINEISRMIGRTNRSITPLVDYLNDIPKIKEEKIEKAAQKKKEEEVKECSFHPEINHLSEIIVSEKKKTRPYHTDVFENLFSDHKKKFNPKQRKTKENFTFQPNLNKSSINLLNKNNEDFLTRLEKDQFARKEKAEKNEQLISNCIDPISGEQYFKPNLNEFRFPLPQEYLNRKSEKDHSPSNKSNDSNDSPPSFKPNDYSQKIFELKKLKRIYEIFSLLDSDEDGFISKNKMNVDNLPDLAYNILKPTLIEIEDKNIVCNFQDFVNEVGKLMKKLTVKEKAEILELNKKEKDYNGYKYYETNDREQARKLFKLIHKSFFHFSMKITPIPMLDDNYSYIIVPTNSTQSIIVDPSESEPILKFLETNPEIKIKSILLTHKHWDHIGGLDEFLKKYSQKEENSKIDIFAGEEENLTAANNNLKGGEKFKLADDIEMVGFAAPCHTRGHMLYYLNSLKDDRSAVFTGDTLFLAGCGKFFQGTPSEMLSNMNIISSLPDKTLIYCGHEYTISNLQWAIGINYETEIIIKRLEIESEKIKNGEFTIPGSVAEEKKTNLFMRCREEKFIEHLKAKDAADAMGILRKMKDLKMGFLDYLKL